MKKNIAEHYLKELPLTAEDAARLVLEFTEELAPLVEGLSRAELIRLLRRAIRHGAQQLAQSEQTVSFAEAAHASVLARERRRPTTRRDLKHFIRRILRIEGVGERPLRAMNTTECREVLQKAFGQSANSYRKGRAILHSIFAYGIRREWCDQNPIDRIDVPDIREKPITPLSIREVRQLEATANLPAFRDMQLALQLMLYCGVRPTEITRLKPEDIRWDEKELIIRPTSSKTGGGRNIPLRRIRRRQVEQVAPKNWNMRWQQLRRAAGFDYWQPDILRHTFASYHAAYFRDLHTLQLEMGHRDSSLLRCRYISPVSRKDAVEFWSPCRSHPASRAEQNTETTF